VSTGPVESAAPTGRVRVLWVVKGLGPGGAERLLVAAAQAHDRSTFEIDCVYLLPWKDHLAGELEAAGVRTTCIGDGPGWPMRLARLVRNGGYDVVHAHSPLPGSIARVATRTVPVRRRPVTVTTEHNTWPSHRPATRWLNRVTSPLDAATFAVTQETLASMRGPTRHRARVLIHGIDVRAVASAWQRRGDVRRELGLTDDEFVVVTAANFRPQKDYPNLLEAMRLLGERGAPVRLVAVGQGPGEAATRARAERMGLADRVILTGFRADAVEVMAVGDCFVLASAWEGLPVALMEAFALGLPVVATAVGGVAETITDGRDGLLVPPGNPAALADALELVATDTDLRERLATASAARAPEFDAARAEATLEDTYRSQVHRPITPADVDNGGVARRRPRSGLAIRPATPDDRPEVLRLLERSMGRPHDPRFARLFAWKHDENPFGPSPAWVAVDGDRIVGLRVFMRWEFVRDGRVLRAVRAVDTATDPEYQSRGLFRALTEHALDEMLADGVDFVFNTPNSQSLPGYLKMGWREVGRLPASFRPRVGSLPRLARARVPADHWSLPLDAGRPVEAVLPELARLVGTEPSESRRLTTHRSAAYLEWRFANHVVPYRSFIDAESDLIIVVRLRRRGPIEEGVVGFVAGRDDAKSMANAVTRVQTATQADSMLLLGRPPLAAGYVPVPGGGPLLTWRALRTLPMPHLGDWSLSMSDVELF